MNMNNYNNYKEYFVDDLEHVDDILDHIIYEDTDIEGSCRGALRIAFQHLIKYEIIRYKQDTAWIASIKRVISNVGTINELNKNNIRNINRDLDKIYNDARNSAKNELKKKGYKEANFVCSLNRPGHYSLEFMFNEDAIDNYLKSISITREVRDYYGLSPKLSRAEEDILYNRIPLDKAFPKK